MIESTSALLDVSKQDLMGSSRRVDLVVKRWIVWYCCLKATGITMNDLGNMFGRTRGAVEHGMESLENELAQSARARQWMEQARKAL